MPYFRLFSYHKGNFWIFQVAGWLIFSVYVFLVTTDTVFTRASGIRPFVGISVWIVTGFLLTLGLRTVYLCSFYKNSRSWIRILIAVLLPLALTSIWIAEWNVVLDEIFLLKTRYTVFDSLKNFLLDFVFVFGPIYLWTLFYFGIKNWYSFYDQKIKAEKAVSMLNRAKLQMLRYQLNPHFLFNSLNSIKALINENPSLAEATVDSLSEFLRATLQYNEKLLIPVSEELKIIGKYLTIEKLRYEERLDYSLEMDKNLTDAEIPCLITQPLVENAIKYGLFRNPDGITIAVRMIKKGSTSVLEVSNTGQLAAGWKKGVGLTNLLDRLENSFPGRYGFSLEQEDGKVIARIIIKME